MATEHAQTATSQALLTDHRRLPLRRLWQVPLFCAGIAALVTMGIIRPFRHEDGLHRTDRDLRAAFEALEQAKPELDRAQAIAENVLARPDCSARQTGEARYLLGSVYGRRALAARGPAPELWKKARGYLEDAESLGVSDEHRPRLTYRLAQAWFQTGGDPQRIVDYLSRSLDQGADDLATGYGMLAQAFLRFQPPGIEAALQANQKELALPTLNEEVLAPARLLRGELLLQLKQRDEARLVLSCIKRGKPAGIYARARWLRALSYQEDELWREAGRLWEEVVKDQEEPPAEPDRALYYLGVCQLRQHRTSEAARAWTGALACSGEGGQAAALRLAELQLHNTNTADAWKAFERGLRDIPSTGFRNSLINLSNARRICEEGCQYYSKIGEYELSKKLALMYARLAPPGMAQELVAQALDAWAQSLLEHSRRAGTEEAARREEEAARARFRETGEAYEAAADQAGTPAAQADWLWQSADRYIQARDHARALAALQRFLQLKLSPERRGEAWFALGMVQQSLHQDAEAREAYHKCIELQPPGAFAYRARYQLAEAEIAQGHLAEAEEILKQNLELMGDAPDGEAHEDSLLALAGLLFRGGNYRVAALRLQEALDRYPSDPRIATARFALADCYRRLAAQENRLAGPSMADPQGSYGRQQYRRWLKMAAANYQKLKDDLTAREDKGPLSATDESLLRQANFAEAECRFDLGKYDEAIRLYEGLVVRYQHKAESLDALAQITRCLWVQRQPDKALKTLQRLRNALKDVDDAALSASTVNQTRPEWEEWLNKATKLCVVP